jgi:hypothetical protein
LFDFVRGGKIPQKAFGRGLLIKNKVSPALSFPHPPIMPFPKAYHSRASALINGCFFPHSHSPPSFRHAALCVSIVVDFLSHAYIIVADAAFLLSSFLWLLSHFYPCRAK